MVESLSKFGSPRYPGYMTLELVRAHPGRETLITRLHTYWASSSPPFVHIYDPTTPQDTSQIIQTLLSQLQEQSSVVLDATECVTPKLVFDRILNGLAEWTPDWDAGSTNWASNASGERYNGSIDAFIHGLRVLHREKQKPMIIVVTHAERLKENIAGVVIPLSRLRDLTSLPISVVFHSRTPWEEVRPAIGSAVVPEILHISALGPEDIVATLQLQFEQLVDDSSPNPFHSIFRGLFNSYVETISNTSMPSTQDLNDVGYIAATHWPLFVSPLINDWVYFNEIGEEYEIPSDASGRLYSMFRQSIGSSIRQLHPRHVDALSWNAKLPRDLFQLRLSQGARSTASARKEDGNTQFANLVRLPTLSRYILVASYLCSFNPTRMDARILGQMRDPTKRSRNTKARKPRPGTALKIGSMLSGPGSFGHDRLWAVSGALLEVFGSNENPPWANSFTAPGAFSEEEVTRVHFISQIEMLVSRRLLIRSNQQEKIEVQAMYRCGITMEQASAVSESLSIKLGPLLHEETV